MDAVEKRVSERLAAEGKSLAAEHTALLKEREKGLKEAEKIASQLGALADVVGVTEGKKLPTEAQTDKLLKLTGALPGKVRKLRKLTLRINALTEKIAKLEDPATLTERVAAARALGVGDEPMSGPDAAAAVLLHEGRALHVEDITRIALERGTVKLTGKTPTQTMSAYLAKAAREGDRFVRIAPGVFDLKEREVASEEVAAA